MSGGKDFNLVEHLAEHVKDGNSFHFPWGELHIPEFLSASWAEGGLGITRFVVLEMMVAVAMVAIFIPMAAHLRGGHPAKGRLWNLFETFLVYLRDHVIVAAIGSKKDAAPYVPYLWSLFFFVLFCNLAGLIPWLGSPTGSVTVTATLAILTLTIVIGTGIMRHGPVGFWTGMVPHIEGKVGPIDLALVLNPMLFCLEIFSFFVKHCSLCIRLMANMFGGHLMMAVFFGFIPLAAWSLYVWLPVTVFSLGGAFAISFLELLVAFIQAYIFTFLTSIYIGMAIHQH